MTYVPSNLCCNEDTTSCFVEINYIATRGDGRKVKVAGIYDYRGIPEYKGVFHPHFLHEHLRELRNLYEADSSYAGQLYDQVGYMISKAVDRNGALVWENDKGFASAMEQGEFAYMFASIANTFKAHGDLANARGMMDYAMRFARAFDMQAGVHSGGVCSFTSYGGAKRARFRPCWWFHSRGVHILGMNARTVLNQHLHAVRDLLYTYHMVKLSPELIDPQFGTAEQVLDFLKDKAIGGLYQLAFTEGHHHHTAPTRPPNISQFMLRKNKGVKPTPEQPDGNPLAYYWAHYEFMMDTGKGSGIAHEKNCEYHTHVLDLISNIKLFIDEHAYFRDTRDGWRLYEAMDALLQGKGEPTGLPESKNALYQFYRSESPAYKERREGCAADPALSEDALAMYRAVFG
jgi:hypothetical protein